MKDFSRTRRTAVPLLRNLRRSSVFAIEFTTKEHCLTDSAIRFSSIGSTGESGDAVISSRRSDADFVQDKTVCVVLNEASPMERITMSTNANSISPFPTFVRVGRTLVQMRKRINSEAYRPILVLSILTLVLVILFGGLSWRASRRSEMSPLIHELVNRGVFIGIVRCVPVVPWLHFPPYLRLSSLKVVDYHVKLSSCNRLDQETWSLISQLKIVSSIDLSDTEFRASDLASLASLAQLNRLVLSRSNVDDAALETLANFTPRIQHLSLDDTAITDASIKTLVQNFPCLTTLAISGTNISAEGLEEIEQGMPRLIIAVPIPKPTASMK